ncbi:MAG: BLUF domain-containing protein [Chloroflexota bacterium]|nr:BLUF domain-containing protein [Chloroflexota bacterium]
MALITLVYVSVASHIMTDKELQDILKVAREHNGKHNISGMLLYRDGYFIQALEGEESIVVPLYDKIRKDPRHMNVLTVYKNEINNRVFENWSMGFNKIETGDLEKAPGLNDFMTKAFDHSYFETHPGRAVALLEQFRDRTFF